ncbi:hypothetical protein [Clostridium butanoliproducens]|uniref:hypothetical protein n=1 Tax=Clostridium butanoliproducens TaxID=2991837 RepID=UPI0024BB6ED2|nr:hypothetical protein [Clostridium butanoliproducens]
MGEIKNCRNINTSIISDSEIIISTIVGEIMIIDSDFAEELLKEFNAMIIAAKRNNSKI